MSIQPDDGIVPRFQAKRPGAQMHLRSVEMQFNYQDTFATRSPEQLIQLFITLIT